MSPITACSDRVILERFIQQHVTEQLAAVLGDLGLLLGVAVVLKRQDHRPLGRLERRLGDCFYHVLQGRWRASG